MGDQVENERKRPDRGALTSAAQGALEQRPIRAALAQRDHADSEPWQQLDIVAKLGRFLRERDRLVDGFRARRRVAPDDPGHPHGDRREEAGAGRWIVGKPRAGALGDRQHLDRVARVEASASRLHEHRDREFAVGSLRRGGQQGVPVHNRSPAGSDASGEPIDLDQPRRVVGFDTSLIEQRGGPIGEARIPGGVGRFEQQPRAPLDVGRVTRGSLERCRRGRIRAALPTADGGQLERRRRRLIGANRCRREAGRSRRLGPEGRKKSRRRAVASPRRVAP